MFRRNYCVILTTKELKDYLSIINRLNLRYIVTPDKKENVWAVTYRTNKFVRSWIDRELEKLEEKRIESLNIES